MKIRISSRIGGCLLLAALTGGCTGDFSEQLLVDPGRFDYVDCPEIVRLRQVTAEREKQLKTLIERAEKEPVGSVIAIPAYRGDYVKAQGEQKTLAEVMQRKNCPPDTPAGPVPQPTRSKRH